MDETERRLMVLETAMMELLARLDHRVLEQTAKAMNDSLDSPMEDEERAVRRGVLELLDAASYRFRKSPEQASRSLASQHKAPGETRH